MMDNEKMKRMIERIEKLTGALYPSDTAGQQYPECGLTFSIKEAENSAVSADMPWHAYVYTRRPNPRRAEMRSGSTYECGTFADTPERALKGLEEEMTKVCMARMKEMPARIRTALEETARDREQTNK